MQTVSPSSYIVQLQQVGKKFGSSWIFRNVTLELANGDGLAILGGNGSGKSTLLQVIAGSLTASAGQVVHSKNGLPVQDAKIYRHISICAPYLDLLEDLTLAETVAFHFSLKPLLPTIENYQQVVDLIGLGEQQHKLLKQFSSGMRQRVKLALALFTHGDLLLLDEPTSNLDKVAIAWYHNLIEQYKGNDRIAVVCSNQQKDEYWFCNRNITTEDYKNKAITI